MTEITVSKNSMNSSLSDVADMLGRCEFIGNPALQVQRVQLDSRAVELGDLFIALKGERFDAHDFLTDISKINGVSVLVNKAAKEKVKELGLNAVFVEDTKNALGELAKAWRAKHSIPLIAVTGSNGKTTVTQMIASILKSFAGENSLATVGNLNNEIGVPQTLLRLRAHHTCSVVELGMNHPGEIAYLANLTNPSVGLVNNAQREHQEFMNSVEAVAIENAQVIKCLEPNGIAVFPADDEYTDLWIQMCEKKKFMTFALGHVLEDSNDNISPLMSKQSDVFLLSAEFEGSFWNIKVQTPTGVVNTTLNIAGKHNVKNALAAITSCVALNIPLSDISKGLSLFEPVKGRSRSFELRADDKNIAVIDDTYNANPDSVIAAIEVLKTMKAPRILILGDMGEVGAEGPRFHSEVGAYAADKGITSLFGLGELTQHSVAAFNKKNMLNGVEKSGIHFDSMQDLRNEVPKIYKQYSSILVKGSRFMKMEQVVNELQESVNLKANVLNSVHLEEGTCS